MKTTFICEIGINHHGDMEKAFRMIEKAKESGASFAKFQYYSPIKVLGKEHPALDYASQCFLSKGQHETLKRHCETVGIDYLVSVFDVRDVAWADSLCKAHKIASRMNQNAAFISAIERTKKPVFMSVQPELSVRIPDRFNLMWCIRDYPATKKDVLAYPYRGFGLSSHCPDPSATLEAWKAGARVIENHVCESHMENGCDISSSLTFDEYREIIKQCAS